MVPVVSGAVVAFVMIEHRQQTDHEEGANA